MAGDGGIRFQVLSALLVWHKVYPNHYSLVGPLGAVPLWLLGKLWLSPRWWCERYNFILFVGSLLLAYRMLASCLPRRVLLQFLALLAFGSMFPYHLRFFFGEVFTALAFFVGTLLVTLWDGALQQNLGWLAMAVGAANTPGVMAGFLLLVLVCTVEQKRLQPMVGFLLALTLVGLEALITRSGPVFLVGDHGNPDVMPYSGVAGFGNPLFFGVLSLLLSFGKGVLFFAPGLLLYDGRLLQQHSPRLLFCYKLWMAFLLGLLLTYAKWWDWSGDYFWGPRYFLFAGIPASLSLALALNQPSMTLSRRVVLVVAALLSLWVGLDAAVFGDVVENVWIQNHFALQALHWYTPEYSALWCPFRLPADRLWIAFDRYLFCFFYWLGLVLYFMPPLLAQLAAAVGDRLRVEQGRWQAMRWRW